MGCPMKIGIWSEEMDVALFWRDEKTSFVSCQGHDGAVFKFPAGRPQVGDSVVCMASWDAVMRRGMQRPVTRRVVRVKPADRRDTHRDLWIGTVSAGTEQEQRPMLLLGGSLAIRDDEKPSIIMPPISAPIPIEQYCDPNYAEQLMSECADNH